MKNRIHCFSCPHCFLFFAIRWCYEVSEMSLPPRCSLFFTKRLQRGSCHNASSFVIFPGFPLTLHPGLYCAAPLALIFDWSEWFWDVVLVHYIRRFLRSCFNVIPLLFLTKEWRCVTLFIPTVSAISLKFSSVLSSNSRILAKRRMARYSAGFVW